MDTNTIPERWVTGSKVNQQLYGPGEAARRAWNDAGKPADYKTFCKGYEAAAKAAALPAEVVSELKHAHRIIQLMLGEMGTPALCRYQRKAQKEGLLTDCGDTRFNERLAAIAAGESLS